MSLHFCNDIIAKKKIFFQSKNINLVKMTNKLFVKHKTNIMCFCSCYFVFFLLRDKELKRLGFVNFELKLLG